ncbi:MAG: hypothetical protein J6B22_07600 [Clostridia bacterium]|nr:hypothetical protein [Clostridia bacterium]
MSINSIENTTRYTAELDKMFAQKSATGFFADNTLATKFVGAKTVIIPDVNFQGLANYDRDSGFSRGAITVSNASYTMEMDRARSLQIDREDMDETGIANLAGQILGEYVRTKVVPECDAYVISKLAKIAETRANTVNANCENPYETLIDLINKVQSAVGFDEELVAFIDNNVFALLQNSTEIAKTITVSDFKQGDVNLKVKSINGVTLIPVVSERMKTAYTFRNNAAGGFVPADDAKSIYMMVCPKKGAHLVKKTENMRIFTPEQNVDADAYKFDYRIYYDVFVPKSGLDSIWACVSPELSITAQPTDIEVAEGEISGSLSVTATSEGELSYQWYKCANEGGDEAVKVAGANASTLAIPEALEGGKHYFFCLITVNGITGIKSDIACVTVE